MTVFELKNTINSGALDGRFAALCGIDESGIAAYRARAISACDGFAELYGADRDVMLLSVGGRSEISGNHTDHNHGRVIAGAINLDVIAVASPSPDAVIRVKSEGFPEDVVPLSAFDAPDEGKFFTSAAIIAGMGSCFREAGLAVGGFDAYTTSNVLKGSGLSSSAAFEVMIGNIMSNLFCGGTVDNVTIAKMAQRAENVFFGKPCGLMDQTACAVGGFITIDFADPAEPVIEAMDFDLSGAGYALCIVNTGGNHADLNEDYASVPAEMKSVAAALGKSVLREVSEGEIIARAAEIREKCGDRALLRALHFTGENDRVATQVDALRAGDLDGFFRGVLASGNSSYKYLQNVYTVKNVREQGLSVALCLAERLLSGKRAAWRVHGGGFAGTVQAFVPAADVAEFASAMDAVFGDGACHALRIRAGGAVRLA